MPKKPTRLSDATDKKNTKFDLMLSLPHDWEVNMKTKQFCAAVLLYMLSENCNMVSMGFDHKAGLIRWLFVKDNIRFQRQVRYIDDIEKSPDSFEEIATRFAMSTMAKFTKERATQTSSLLERTPQCLNARLKRR